MYAVLMMLVLDCARTVKPAGGGTTDLREPWLLGVVFPEPFAEPGTFSPLARGDDSVLPNSLGAKSDMAPVLSTAKRGGESTRRQARTTTCRLTGGSRFRAS